MTSHTSTNYRAPSPLVLPNPIIFGAPPAIPEELEEEDEAQFFSAPSPPFSPPDSPESTAQEMQTMEIDLQPKPTKTGSSLVDPYFERAMDRRESGDLKLTLEPPPFHISRQ